MLKYVSVRAFLAASLIAFSVPAAVQADTLSRIRESGEFKLGHRTSSMPFSYAADNGAAQGYSVDICRKIFEKVKLELKRPDLKLKFVALQSADRIKAVKEHRVDVECGSTTHTAARALDVDFSYSIFFAGMRFLARKSANLHDWRDLRGKTIAVTEKSTAEIELGIMNSQRGMNMKLVTVPDHAEGFLRMQLGKVHAVVNDDAVLFGLLNTSTTPNDFAFVGKHLSVEPYGILSAKGDAPMSALVDSVVVDLLQSGEIRQLYAKWFEKGASPLPMSMYLRQSMNTPSRFGIP